VVFISEIRQREPFVKGLRYRLGMNNVMVKFGEGKGGGLAFFTGMTM
jgi:hypothetical protein